MKPEHIHIFGSLSDAEWLALNGLCEAWGEVYEGIVAVESVVLNRADHPRYPDSISEVIAQKNQFSWLNSNDPQYGRALTIAKDFKAGLRKYPTLHTCLDIAEKLMSGEMPRNVKATIYFNPQTATNKKFVEAVHSKCMFEQKIGRHEFWIE
jgi:N-acetylmuramoyl-L-alanine amidase